VGGGIKEKEGGRECPLGKSPKLGRIFEKNQSPQTLPKWGGKRRRSGRGGTRLGPERIHVGRVNGKPPNTLTMCFSRDTKSGTKDEAKKKKRRRRGAGRNTPGA